MGQADGIVVPGLGSTEVHRIWVVFACVLVPFLLFEALAFYFINHGKKAAGGAEGEAGKAVELRPRSPPSAGKADPAADAERGAGAAGPDAAADGDGAAAER